MIDKISLDYLEKIRDQIWSGKEYGNVKEKMGSGKKETGTGILFAAHPTYQLREEKKEGTAKKSPQKVA